MYYLSINKLTEEGFMDWYTVLTSLISSLLGSSVLCYLIQHYSQIKMLKFQKLYDKQIDFLLKVNTQLYELEEITINLTREYVHVSPSMRETDDSINSKITSLLDEFYKKLNDLTDYLKKNEPYCPNALESPIRDMYNKMQYIIDQMCKSQSLSYQEKVSKWEKYINEDWRNLRKKWIKRFRHFMK